MRINAVEDRINTVCVAFFAKITNITLAYVTEDLKKTIRLQNPSWDMGIHEMLE